MNEILNEMRAEDVFSTHPVPNRSIFEFYPVRVSFHYSNVDENRERWYRNPLEDPHVVTFCSADDYHELQLVAQFASAEHSEEWRQALVEE